MDEVTRAFAQQYWDHRLTTVFGNSFMGVPCIQNPFDVQVTEELIWQTRPDVIVECGSLGGGSALRWAAALECFGIDGTVVAIDIEDRMDLARERPLWDRRVRFLQGSTVDAATLAQVVAIIDDRRTMVILDSDHTADHVLAELHAYAPLVTPGCYLIVQDGIVSTVDPSYGPGPLEAVTTFLADDDRFEMDLTRERQFFTFNPSGFLLRR